MHFRFAAYKNNGGMLRCVRSGMMCIDFHRSSDRLLRISFMNFHAFVIGHLIQTSVFYRSDFMPSYEQQGKPKISIIGS